MSEQGEFSVMQRRATSSRRPHRKSRLGCGTCKRRRIKCDEKLIECGPCKAFGVRCDYLDLPEEELLIRSLNQKFDRVVTENLSRLTYLFGSPLPSVASPFKHFVPDADGRFSVEPSSFPESLRVCTRFNIVPFLNEWFYECMKSAYQHPYLFALLIALASRILTPHYTNENEFQEKLKVIYYKHLTIALPFYRSQLAYRAKRPGNDLLISAVIIYWISHYANYQLEPEASKKQMYFKGVLEVRNLAVYAKENDSSYIENNPEIEASISFINYTESSIAATEALNVLN